MENNFYLINSYEYDCRAICKEHCVTLAVTGFLIRGLRIFSRGICRGKRELFSTLDSVDATIYL